MNTQLETSADSKASLRWRWKAFILLLAAVTLLSRLSLVSRAYFADGPAHIANLRQGILFIQPPGYFLFMWSAHCLMELGFSPEKAIACLNISLNIGGVVIFALICRQLFSGAIQWLLPFSYAFMNVVWFSALIHSSYVSMALFGPALFYCLIQKQRSWFFIACLVWAIGTGFRPSDGVFLSLMLIVASVSHSCKDRAIGLLLASGTCLCWWIPTAIHYGGGILSPIQACFVQAAGVSQYVSVLRVGITPRSIANIARFFGSVLISSNVLLPAVIFQTVLTALARTRDFHARLCLAWIVPGSLFFLLTYMSDAVYIAFMAGGILISAGLYCASLPRAFGIAWVASNIVASLLFMLVLHPLAPSSFPRRVANAFCLEYTAWGVMHQYHKNLSDLERESAHGST